MEKNELQTFQLNSPVQLLLKLAWGIKQLKASLKRPEESSRFFPAVYTAFDCAITAWQLSDWVWAAIEDKSAILRKVPAEYSKRKPLKQFQALLCEQSKYLRICCHIANSNKHFGVDQNYDPNLKVSVEWAVDSSFAVGMPIGKPLIDRSFKLIVRDSDQEYEALEVMLGALEFWAAELDQKSIVSMIDDL